jgi:hypothetical protein
MGSGSGDPGVEPTSAGIRSRIRRRGAHCLTLFRFGKWQGSGNSKNATALRHIDNVDERVEFHRRGASRAASAALARDDRRKLSRCSGRPPAYASTGRMTLRAGAEGVELP